MTTTDLEQKVSRLNELTGAKGVGQYRLSMQFGAYRLEKVMGGGVGLPMGQQFYGKGIMNEKLDAHLRDVQEALVAIRNTTI